MISSGILLAGHYQTGNVCHLIMCVPSSQRNKFALLGRLYINATEIQFRKEAIKNINTFSLNTPSCTDAGHVLCVFVFFSCDQRHYIKTCVVL